MFFDQIKEIDGNIKQLRDDLKLIGDSTGAHFDQLDDIAAHIIALEAIVATMLASNPVDKDAVMEWIKSNTAETSESSDGSEKVRMIADQLLP